MTTENRPNRSGRFVPSKLPWLLAAVMLAVYLLTLNHWISQSNWGQIAALNGWDWSPNLFAPVTFLLSYPLRWLPTATIPLAANLFNTVCAVLTLALLARSVALLPHDRTHGQRQRELSEFSLLTIRSAWVPPVLAVLACGLQLTFWEHAIEASGQMLDLLLFAYLVRCLLEFRLLEKDSWLNRFALVCGLLAANDRTMLVFLPGFLAAVVWVKGLRFFDLGFLTRLFCFWLAGFSLLFLMPLLASFSHAGHLAFGPGVHAVLAGCKALAFQFWGGRFILLVLSVTSLVPILFIAIRWSSFFGDTSPLGIFITNSMLHLVQGLFLGAGIWVVLGAPFSPLRMGFPFPPFYYLGALSIGYFSGYFLLVFGTPVAKSRVESSPAARPLGQLLDRGVTAAVWILLPAVPGLLVGLNLAKVHEISHDPMLAYVADLEKSLPARNAVLLGDDPFRQCMCVIRSDWAKAGRGGDNLLIDTSALRYPAYLEHLNQAGPQFHLQNILSNDTALIIYPRVQMHMLDVLSQSHELYYLHPSFGYYFEEFHVEPRGLLLQLKAYGSNDLFAPLLTPAQIEENATFWKNAARGEFPALLAAMRASTPPVHPNVWQRFLTKARLKIEPNRRAEIVGLWYARSLDYLGVQMQRSGALAPAGECFALAHELNPNNAAARINQEFNRDLQAGKPADILPVADLMEKAGGRRNWGEILESDGPFDDPNFCLAQGAAFAQARLLRQALESFHRAVMLAPSYTNAHLALAEAYFAIGRYTNALTSDDQALRLSPAEPGALFLRGVTYMQMKEYEAAIPPLTQVIGTSTNNYMALLNRAIAYLQSNKLEPARQDYVAATKLEPQAYQAYYGLGEIGYRQSNKPMAITNYQIYLTNLHRLTNAAGDPGEVKEVESRLKQLTAPPQ